MILSVKLKPQANLYDLESGLSARMRGGWKCGVGLGLFVRDFFVLFYRLKKGHFTRGRHGIDGLVSVRCKHAVGCIWTT